MKMKWNLRVFLGLVLAGLVVVPVGEVRGVAEEARLVEPHMPDPPIELVGGAASVDELLDTFLAALERSDRDALDALRLTKEEYQLILVPGRVAHGAPPRRVSPEVEKYFWEMLDFKSKLFTDVLLTRFGGKKLARGEVRFTKPIESYDWYRALGETRQSVIDPDGNELVVSAGSIAEVNGRFKFVSFIWDD